MSPRTVADLRPVDAGWPRYRIGRTGGDGLPVVLLPGIEGDARIFARLDGLARARPVEAWDLPDEGDLPDQAARLWRALDRAGHDRPLHLFGASLGGLLAWQLAAARPDRVASLTTLGSLPAARHRPLSVGVAARALASTPDAVVRRTWRARLRRRYAEEGITSADAQALLSALPPPAIYRARIRAVARWHAPPAPAVPTWWLLGQVDREAPWTAQDVAAALPRAHVETVPGGHRAMLTHPEPLVAVLSHLLRAAER